MPGKLLLTNVFQPLISHPSLRPLLEEQPDAVALRFESVGQDLGRPSPLEVFAKIKLVLEALHKHQLGRERLAARRGCPALGGERVTPVWPPQAGKGDAVAKCSEYLPSGPSLPVDLTQHPSRTWKAC